MKRTIKALLFLVTLYATNLNAQSPTKLPPTAPPAASTKWKCGMSGPPTVAFVGDTMYWTDFSAGKVMKNAVHGGSGTVVASAQKGPCAITTDGSSVYWTNNSDGTVMKMPIREETPVVLARNQRQPSEICVSRKYVAWMTADGPHSADLQISSAKTSRAKAVLAMSSTSDDSDAGGGTNPGTVKCHVCPVYCTRYNPVTGKNESYICGWQSCPPCGA